jgi:hypothetical protein
VMCVFDDIAGPEPGPARLKAPNRLFLPFSSFVASSTSLRYSSFVEFLSYDKRRAAIGFQLSLRKRRRSESLYGYRHFFLEPSETKASNAVREC